MSSLPPPPRKPPPSWSRPPLPGRHWWDRASVLVPAALIFALLLMVAVRVGAGNGGGDEVVDSAGELPRSEIDEVVTDTGEPDPTAQEEPAQQPSREDPIELSGDGEINTDPFTLAGGDYRSTVTVAGDCAYFLALRDPAGSRISVDVTAPAEPGEATDRLYNVEGGDWYVHMNTGPPPRCPWTLRLDPLG